jgi:hypothetical protein
MAKRLEGIEGELTGLRNENEPRDEILRRIIDEVNELWKKGGEEEELHHQ